jgi:WD repeat-containing protein 19
MKQLIEAAQLYMKGNLPEKAANIYISLKMFNQATPLLDKIKSPKLLIQLAKVIPY